MVFSKHNKTKTKAGQKKNEEKYRNLKEVLKGKMLRVMMKVLK